MIDMQSQSLGMETLGNARELGGYKTLDGRTVKHGVLLRSAKPYGASASDLEKLKDKYHLGVITDFRMAFEREREPNPSIKDVKDVWCPIIDEDLFSANIATDSIEHSTSLFDRLKIAVEKGLINETMYVGFISMAQGKKGYAEFFRELLDLPEGKSLLFHCTQGKDRTGLGAMLILSVLGVDEQTVMQDYLLTNDFNATLIEKEKLMLSKYNLPEEDLHRYLSAMDWVNPRFMQNAIDYLKKEYGSIKGYVTRELCVTEDDIEKLKKKFLEK